MNLHGMVAGAIGVVNPFIPAELWQSVGYSIVADGDGTQVPQYKITQLMIQVQALSNDELHRLDGLNLQANKQAVYLSGDWNGVLRAGQQGGDLLKFNGRTWLVTVVLESWPDWTKIAVTMQIDT